LLPPEADGSVFLSGVWCHVSPAPGKVAAAFGDRLTAVSPEPSIPDGVAAYINTGIERRAQIKKSGARSNSRKFLQKIFLTARDRTTGYSRFWCVERPDSAIDNGNALIFPGQIEIRPSAATGYPAISRVD
jgi:hypothetical protein